MLDSQQKRKVNGVLYHKATLIVLCILTILIIRSTILVYQKKVESDSLMTLSQKNKDALDKRVAELDNQINILHTQGGKEAEIRSKFNVAKDNESIVVIVEEENATITPKSRVDFWQRLLNLFKN